MHTGYHMGIYRTLKEPTVAHRILIVEDEPGIAHYVQRGLAYEGFAVEVAGDGFVALAAARERPPDLVVLDLMLPGMDGIEIARRLRAGSDVPIIMLTARDAVADRVAGLESGADDYMPKPFAFEELLARIHARLRRTQAHTSGEVLCVGPLRLDISAHDVRVGEQHVNLTPKEFELLAVLVRHAGRVVTHRQILTAVWGPAHTEDLQYLRVFIGQLRQKLAYAPQAPDLIQNEPGIGYRLISETE